MLDIVRLLTDTLDSEKDLAERARLLGMTRTVLSQTLDDRLFRICYDLHESGWTHREIAEALCLKRPTVTDWLRRYCDQHGIPRETVAEREQALAEAIEIRAGYKG